jgi:CRISPR/Cas system CSM-associated protein Csm4 (group 5 of RAMP superfamily)
MSPNGRNGEEGARWRLSPRRGYGVGGAAEFPVRGGALTVGAVGKATGRGVLPVGCFRSRMEEGKRTEAWQRRAASF